MTIKKGYLELIVILLVIAGCAAFCAAGLELAAIIWAFACYGFAAFTAEKYLK